MAREAVVTVAAGWDTLPGDVAHYVLYDFLGALCSHFVWCVGGGTS
jgi:hypothetical protein